jgi:hypothetical protein
VLTAGLAELRPPGIGALAGRNNVSFVPRNTFRRETLRLKFSLRTWRGHANLTCGPRISRIKSNNNILLESNDKERNHHTGYRAGAGSPLEARKVRILNVGLLDLYQSRPGLVT